MKFNIPKITTPIDLADFAPELKHDDGTAALVYAWVNPPTMLLNSHAALQSRAQVAVKRFKEVRGDEAALAEVVKELGAIGAGLGEVFAELWSARSEPATHWTAEEVNALANNQENPALYGWLTGRTIAAINEYRGGLRKN